MELVDCIRTMRYLMGNTSNKNFVGVELPPTVGATTDVELLQVVRNHVWGTVT
jgi:hypothetical protein